MRIATVVGNPKASSRTLGVAATIAEVLAESLEGAHEQLTIDLAEFTSDIFDWQSTRLADLTEQVAASNLLIVASPTFKATYTGLLKAFFDRYGTNGLAGVVAVPVMTGAAPMHALAPEVHLRPLLVELGASVPTRGLYVTEDQLGEVRPTVGLWAETAVPLIRRALA